MAKGSSKSSKEMGPVTLEYTIRLRHMVRDVAFKKRAPRAVRNIKALAAKVMKTKDVRIDTSLNEAIWARGIRKLPMRLRVRLSRKRNEAEDAEEPFYTVVEPVECSDFRGRQHEVVQDQS